MRWPGLCSDSYVSQSPLASVCRTVNFYPEIIGGRGAKVDVALYPTPGLASYVAASEKPNRGIFHQNGLCFAVIGQTLYQVTELTPTTGTLTNRGTVATNTEPAYMTTNGDGGDELAISCGGQLYILDLTNLGGGLTNPTGTADFVVFLNGRFCVLDASASILKISNALDGSGGYSTLQSQRDSATDPWKALAVSKSGKELWLMGEASGDVWFDAGAYPIPFEPRQGLLIEPGIEAPHSLADLHGSMMWLTHDHVVRAIGYRPQHVSSEALDHAITQYEKNSRIDDAVGQAYQHGGHYFYSLNFPSAGATWVYDESTNWWHERGKYAGTSDTYLAWGPQYHAHAFAHHLTGDFRSGTIYRMADDLYLDTDGDALRRLRIAPALFSEHRRMYLDRLELYVETGLGVVTGQGSDPQVMLRTSKNSKTWSSERWASAGKIGEFDRRVVWHQLGSGRDLVASFAMSDPVPWRIVDAYMDVRMG